MAERVPVALIDASHSLHGRGGTKYHAFDATGLAVCGAGLVFDTGGDYADNSPAYMLCGRPACRRVMLGAQAPTTAGQEVDGG
jgi:hypothetical protein